MSTKSEQVHVNVEIVEQQPQQQSPKLPKKQSHGKLISLRKYFRYADLKDRVMMVFGLLCAAVNGCGLPISSVVFGELLDSFGDANSDIMQVVGRVAVTFLIIGIVTGVCQFFQVYCWRIASLNQANRIRLAYIHAILKKDITWYDTRKIAEISAQMDSDCRLIQDGFSDKFSSPAQFISMFLAGIGVGFIKGWQLTLIIFAVVPFLALGGALMTKSLGEMSSRSQKAYGKAGAIASQAIHSIPTVSQFNSQARETEKYNSSIEYAQRIGERKGKIIGGMLGYTQCMLFITYGLSLWYGGKLIADGTINTATGSRYTGGDVMSVFFAVLLGAFALGQAAPNFPAIANGRSSAYRIFNIIDGTEEIDSENTEINSFGKEEAAGGETLESLEGNLSFKNVSFSYPTRPGLMVFEGLNLEIEKGKTVALVGESGSGKSTIIGLVERFYEPNSGEILLDVKPISKLDLKWFRQQIGLVSQQPCLFSGTIADNIKVGNPNASDLEIEEAARIANAHDFIKNLPNGYATMLTGSSQLSGGQKQRISIARAVIKKPKLMLLDEATSALDNKSEEEVQIALEKVMKTYTTIVIAHRLSTIRNADKICVFQNGKLKEEGSHDELIKLNSLYKTLVDAQNLSSSETKSEAAEATSGIVGAEKSSVESDNAEKIEEKKSEEYNISDDKAKKEAAKAPISNVFKIALRKWPYIILGVFSSILVGAVWPVYSFILSEMIVVFFLTDYDELRRKALQWMLAFFGLAGGMTILNFLCSYMYAKVGEYVTFELRSKVFSHILKQEIGWFELIENNPGILTTRLASDAEAIRSLAVDRSNVLVQTVVMIAIGIGIAFFNGWQLTLVVLGLAPLIGIAGFFQIKFIVSGAKKAKEAFETANALSAESIAQIRTVKSFNREETTIEKYTEALRFPLLQEARGAVISGLAPAFSNLATFGIYGVVFYIGAKFAEQGWITFDGILKVFFAIVISFLSAGQISQYAPDTSSAHLSVNAIFALLNRESKIDGTNEVDGEKHSLKEKDIVFNDVHFRYPSRPEVEVLKGLNIRVPAGKTVGLVGASGSGKSTIISILQRFYDFEAGQVYVGDTEVRNFNVKHLRGKIGVVSQEPVLFDGTIRENILYGRPEATESELEAAIQQSNVAPFLKNLEYKDDQGNIHKGLDALLGGEGIQLSGGQKQRVAIARAILKDPEILLLDEATSALDNESEKLVQESLEQLMKNRTTLIIAHRLSTIRNADWIIVMDGGKSVEQGTHDQLISQRGIYANLVRIGQKQ